MIGRKLCWLALTLCLFGFCLTAGSAAMVILLAGMFCIPLGLLFVNHQAKKHLSVQFGLPVNQRKNTRAEAFLEVHNNSVFPVLCLHCVLRAENSLNGEARKLVLASAVLPHRTKKLSIAVESPWCGRIRLTAESVRLYDCFGLIGLKWKKEVKGTITIQPDTFDQIVTIATEAETLEDAEQYSPDRPGRDLTETFQIREYVEGDSIRQVHWKLSEKLGKLIIRDPSLPVSRAVTVLWERTEAGGSMERTDAQAEIIVTLCRSLLEQSVPVAAAWNDTAEERCIVYRLTTLDDLAALMPRLLSAKAAPNGLSAAELFLEQTGVVSSRIVYLAAEWIQTAERLAGLGRLTVLSCGEGAPDHAVIFDEKNYEAQLLELEI